MSLQQRKCDRCGELYPHILDCEVCGGTGDHVDGDRVYPGQCSACRGRGKKQDPNEGVAFQIQIGYDGKPLVLNVMVSQFYADKPDLCGQCLVATLQEAMRK